MGLTFLLAAALFAAAMGAMAVGVIISNRRIKGSCGGLANMKDSRGNTICDGCSNPSPECDGPATRQTEQVAICAEEQT